MYFFREKGCNTDSRLIKVVSTRNNFGFRDAGGIAALACLLSLQSFAKIPEIRDTFQKEKSSPISFYVDDHDSVLRMVRVAGGPRVKVLRFRLGELELWQV